MKYLGFFLAFILYYSIVVSQTFSSEKQHQIDSLNAIITKTGSNDTSLAGAYLSLSELLYTSNLDTVIPLCEKTIAITEKALSKNPSILIKQTLLKILSGALNNIGYVYKVQGNTIKALEFYHKSLSVDEELGDKEGLATSFNNIGVLYDRQADIPKALEYYYESLKIKEELGNKLGVSNSLSNIGQLYEQQEDFTKAFDFYNK